MENIRIRIRDLPDAARALGEFKIVAAGSMYATLFLTSEQCLQLSKARIYWSID